MDALGQAVVSLHVEPGEDGAAWNDDASAGPAAGS
jgi:hypothetical protein